LYRLAIALGHRTFSGQKQADTPDHRRPALIRAGRQPIKINLARKLGSGAIPLIPGMSRTDTQVLAALSRSPRGVASVREAARRAGVSPTAAGRALARLAAQGLITATPIMLARGHASEVTVYQVRFGSQEWLALAPIVAKVQLPDRAGRPRARRVPPHLLHLFWNTAPAQLNVATSAPYIARRLLTTFDPDGLAWGVIR
jgi:hypothetical protein